MRFEYDPAKSASNLLKHGIDFQEAQRLWQDPRLFVFVVRAEDEVRYLGVGKIAGRHWSAVFTLRGDRRRLISVRRSRRLEIKRYEGR